MRTHTIKFRLSAAVAIGGLAFAPVLNQAALAQAAPQPPAGQAAPAGDPPARVGRLARIDGTVSFHAADEDHWDPATLNYPITSGNSLWTEPSSGAGIDIDAAHLALDQQTELDVNTLDAQNFAATEPQGGVYLRLSLIGPGQSYTIVTPRGTVTLGAAGRYEVAAGDTNTPTVVTVVEGSAQVSGNNLSVQVGAHQTATITGSDNFQGSVGPETDDAFLTAQLAKEQPRPALAAATTTHAYVPPALVQQMTGSEDLETSGDWASAPQYGHVWYPPVARDWVPYRHGHWAYVAPWGWTWVDDASWGFAPFHYGRWVHVDDRWGWTPGVPDAPGYAADYGTPDYQPPVYAPALVSFVGIAGAALAGAAVGYALGGGFGGRDHGDGSVGWVPLGPNEPYYPPYQTSNNYLRNVNVSNVSNVTNISNVTNNTRTVNNFVNQGAATVVPAAAMTQSQPIAAQAQQVTPQQVAAFRPVRQVPVQPTAQTLGVTPVVARQFHIPAAAVGVAAVGAAGVAGVAASRLARPAPGPAVQARPNFVPGRPLAAVAAPALRPTGTAPVSTRPVAAGVARPAEPAPATPAGQPPRPAGAPGPAIAPHPATVAPALAPHAATPPRPTAPTSSAAPTGAAPRIGAPALAPNVAAPSVAPPSAAPPSAAPALRPAASAPNAAAHPALQLRPSPEAAGRPVPAPAAARPIAGAVPVPAPGPAAAPRAASTPAPRPAPAAAPRPAAAPAPRPAPAPAPAPRPAPAPAPRPAPAPAPRPAPAPAPAPRPAPAAAPRPAPAPPPRPAPAPAPAPHPAPAPAPRPAPAPAPRPAPPPAKKVCPPNQKSC